MKHSAFPLFLLGVAVACLAWYLSASEALLGQAERPSAWSLMLLLALAAAMMVAGPAAWLFGGRGFSAEKLRFSRRNASKILDPIAPTGTRQATSPSGRVRPGDCEAEMPRC